MEVDLLTGSRQVGLHQGVVQQAGQTLQDELEILCHNEPCLVQGQMVLPVEFTDILERSLSLCILLTSSLCIRDK